MYARKEEVVADFPDPMPGSVFYEDELVYACLAFHPIIEGHTIVVWKADVEDIGELPAQDSLYLWGVVLKIRKALLRHYNTDKVYVAYLDESRHVHIHLFPRRPGGEEGFGLMAKPHGSLEDLSAVPKLAFLVGTV